MNKHSFPTLIASFVLFSVIPNLYSQVDWAPPELDTNVGASQTQEVLPPIIPEGAGEWREISPVSEPIVEVPEPAVNADIINWGFAVSDSSLLPRVLGVLNADNMYLFGLATQGSADSKNYIYHNYNSIYRNDVAKIDQYIADKEDICLSKARLSFHQNVLKNPEIKVLLDDLADIWDVESVAINGAFVKNAKDTVLSFSLFPTDRDSVVKNPTGAQRSHSILMNTWGQALYVESYTTVSDSWDGENCADFFAGIEEDLETRLLRSKNLRFPPQVLSAESAVQPRVIEAAPVVTAPQAELKATDWRPLNSAPVKEATYSGGVVSGAEVSEWKDIPIVRTEEEIAAEAKAAAKKKKRAEKKAKKAAEKKAAEKKPAEILEDVFPQTAASAPYVQAPAPRVVYAEPRVVVVQPPVRYVERRYIPPCPPLIPRPYYGPRRGPVVPFGYGPVCRPRGRY